MAAEIITSAIRHYFVGSDQDFTFNAVSINDIDFTPVKIPGLYVHIPFCKSLCPYCPYNKIKYTPELVNPYLKSLLFEIEEYSSCMEKPQVSSIYIGGGTPTCFTNELKIIIDRIRNNFEVTGDICIETNPEDISRDTVNKLRNAGVTLISLGVQSFEDKHLKFLGRNYTEDVLYRAIDISVSSNFKSVNFDMMFALPGQTSEDVMSDIQKAIVAGADQITAYPLFTFPYSKAGNYRKLKKVKLPNLIDRRKMYREIHNYLVRQDFQRVSVWGFKRGKVPRYSSVTRNHFIGLGAGAGSHIPGRFYFNTFSVKDYIHRCQNQQLPIALNMELTETASKYYWLYWRLYDTYINKNQIRETFGENDIKIKQLISIFNILNLAEENEDEIILTEKGSFWLHLLQNYFSLNYINKVWSTAGETAFPNSIKI